MRKLFMFLSLFAATQLFAQTNPITSINISLPANPDANIANWGTGTTVFTVSAVARAANGRVTPEVEESRILITIKKDGAKVCGAYTGATAPAANFNAPSKVWSGTNAASLIGKECTLAPGNYELCVQFFANGAAAPVPLSDEKTKPFTIRGNDQQAYQPPQAIMPATGTAISESDILKPITFRWTPVTPKPAEPVTYRLKVWQLMQGQSGGQAARVNQPIITKDGDNLTQAIVTNIINGPCKPPFLCSFVWNVQALNRDGKPVGGNNGTSETLTFAVQQSNTKEISPPVAVIPLNKDVLNAGEAATFGWFPVNPTPAGPVTYKIKIAEIQEGQSPEEALRTNKPFFEKDSIKALMHNKPFFEKDSIKAFIHNKPFFEKDSFNALMHNKPFFEKDSFQLLTTEFSPATLRLKPGGKYAWGVQALSNGKPYGPNEGKSNVTQFTTSSPGVYINNFKITCVSYGVYSYTLTAENPGNGQFNTQQIGFTSLGNTITGATVSPAVPGALINNGTPVTFTGTFNYSGAYPAAVIAKINGYLAGNAQLTSSDTEQDSLKTCLCKDCDNASLNVNAVSVNPAGSNGNQYTIAGNINVSGLPAVYGLELQIQSYNYTATPAACSNGVAGIEQSGMFLKPGTTINNSTTIQMFNETASGSSSGTNNNAAKTVKLISGSPLPASIPVNLLVGLPGPLTGLAKDCCKMNYNVCIKVKVYYDKDGCKSCTFTYCFPSFSN